MRLLLDAALAGSRIATGVGVALIAAAVAALVWVALRSRHRTVGELAVKATPAVEANAVRRHRRTSRRSTRPVVRHQVVDEKTVVIPVLREQTQLIPPVRGGRRG